MIIWKPGHINVYNIKAVFHTTCIPGHAEIWYNEVADQLAGTAEPIGSVKLYPGDARNRMSEAVPKTSPPRATWWSLSRMESAETKFDRSWCQPKYERQSNTHHYSEGARSNFSKYLERDGHRTLFCGATTTTTTITTTTKTTTTTTINVFTLSDSRR